MLFFNISYVICGGKQPKRFLKNFVGKLVLTTGTLTCLKFFDFLDIMNNLELAQDCCQQGDGVPWQPIIHWSGLKTVKFHFALNDRPLKIDTMLSVKFQNMT